MTHSIGVIGTGVMGKNLAANIASKGNSVALYNRTYKACLDASRLHDSMQAYEKLANFVRNIERPRKVIVMLKAGKPVDEIGKELLPLLDEGDIVVDGGNEWYENTERRQTECLDHGIHWVGMGVSGGEKGARYGPSLMLGGDDAAYFALEEILDPVAASGCLGRIGLGGSGHYVKMVHNGIEYGMMQAIAEVYWILRMHNGMSMEHIANLFENWNKDVFECYLMEITCDILRKKEGNKYLLDQMVHTVSMNGTGTWTAQEGLRVGVPLDTISAAVNARMFGADRCNRLFMDYTYQKRIAHLSMCIDETDLKNALWVVFMCTYAQGLQLIVKKADIKKWNVRMKDVLRVWRDGCIIRSGIVHEFVDSHCSNVNYKLVLSEPSVRNRVMPHIAALRRVVGTCQMCGVAVPVFSATLNYMEQSMMSKGPWSLIQAQRDYFGSHGFERTDKQGVQHAQWWEQ